jgi:hypothetical protein
MTPLQMETALSEVVLPKATLDMELLDYCKSNPHCFPLF